MRARRHARAVASALLLALAMPSAILLGTAAAEPGDDPSTSASPTGTPSETATDTPSTTPTPTTTGPLTVDDAQLRWGINDESNSRAYAPGTFNFFSAGKVTNPGAGGDTLAARSDGSRWTKSGRASGWAAQSGSVRIEKLQSDGSYRQTTFKGTSTDVTGTTDLKSNGGSFSDHQVVMNGGTGTIDPAAGTATVTWKGSFTVLYYSGMSFFYVSDPELRITPAKAQLWGTVGGFKSSMDDPEEWAPAAEQRVVLADLPANLALPSTGGLPEIAVAYRNVRYSAPAGGTPQNWDVADRGAFPQSFVDAMSSLGSGSYWYSSGGAADAHKVALPLTLSYSAGEPVKPPVKPKPTKNPTKGPSKTPTQSVAPPPPSVTPTPSSSSTTQPAGPALPSQSAVALAPPGASPAALAPQSFDPRLPAVPVVSALTSPVASEATSSGHPWEWWAGSLLLLGAAALTTFSSLKGKS